MSFGLGNVATGARARFLCEGTKIMYATNCRYGETIEHSPVEVLDQYEVAENVPVAYRVSLSAQFVRLIKDPIKLREGVRMMPTLEGILLAPELTCAVEDKSGVILANIERVKVVSYTTQFDARGIVFCDVEFNAIRIRDESEIA